MPQDSSALRPTNGLYLLPLTHNLPPVYLKTLKHYAYDIVRDCQVTEVRAWGSNLLIEKRHTSDCGLVSRPHMEK